MWMLAKAGVTKAERRVEAAQRRAKARATNQRLKMEIIGHTEDPEVVAATGGNAKCTFTTSLHFE